jgi:hypothetical protein
MRKTAERNTGPPKSAALEMTMAYFSINFGFSDIYWRVGHGEPEAY